jgi:PAP2 superfamily
MMRTATELRDPSAVLTPMDEDRDAVRLRWYREVALVLVFYALYSAIRNQFGSAQVSPTRAFDNALSVIEVERALHLFIEVDVQQAFLGWDAFLRAWNIFYGTFHFVVTGGVMVFLYRRAPARYRRWRTILACTTGLALIGFSLFPLMPPRLLNDFGVFGGRSASFNFVDTLADVGGLWSFDSEGMQAISNQYAAMPSLHIAWAVWCMAAVLPLVRRTWVRWAFVTYPFVTLFAVVVTANHYWLDGVGGVVVLGVGYAMAVRLERLPWQRLPWRRPPVLSA